MRLYLSRRFSKLWKLSARMATANPEDTPAVESSEDSAEPQISSPSPKRDLRRPKKAEGKGDTRKRERLTSDEDPNGETGPLPAKKSRGKPKGAKTKQTKEEVDAPSTAATAAKPKASKVTDWASMTWDDLGQTSDSRPWNIKFSSWNVNGVRAWLKNGGLEYITHEAPDVFCLQEIKCAMDKLPKDTLDIPGYHTYWNPAEKAGYSGTGLYSKVKPLNVTFGMGVEKHDTEGRLITCEYDKFYFVTAYVPNAGEKVKRLSYRQEWDVDFRAYLKNLDSKKPLILCGDLNVAHEEIDLKNPKTNTKTAGFTQEERDGFTALLGEGFVDSFRQLYPDRQAFTYWSYRFNARAKNIGWRLDYFVLSQRLMEDVCDCIVRSDVVGSDHCPLVLSMAIS